MLLAGGLAGGLHWWAKLYADSKTVSNAVMSVHLLGLLVGGGGAVAADRDVFRSVVRSEPERRRLLADLRIEHRVVLGGLALTFVSGLLLLAADLDTFLGSVAYWVKMGLVALLLINGWWMTRLERQLVPAVPASWSRLRAAAVLSLVLWCTIVVVSTLVSTAA